MFKKILSLYLCLTFFSFYLIQKAAAEEFLLEKGTIVNTKLINKLSSNLNKEGESIDCIVSEDIKIADIILIKEGTPVKGFVSELIPRGRIGKAGQITVNLESTNAVNSKKVYLYGITTKKGENKMILSCVLSIIATPVSLFFLLMRGTDATIPQGTQIRAKVENDVKISIQTSL